MKTSLENKVAVVTGGTSGIGKAAALALAKAGAKVVVAVRRENEGQAVVQAIENTGGKAIFLKTDVSREADVKALVDKTVATFGRLDIAFNNASIEGQIIDLRGRQVELEKLFAIALMCTMSVLNVSQAQSLTPPADSTSGTALASSPSITSIWQGGIGEGFNPSAQSISLSIGAGYGERILGSRENHDLALSSIDYGHMLGGVKGKGHWYKGNWEWRGELFSGAQFSPTRDWLVGLTPHLRYNFATGHRWIPYCDLGTGVSATSIGPPDLSHTFEFNLQAAAGVRWFLKENLALSVEARYLHLSCAGMDSPNLGLNNVNGMLGISWFF
jgi:lipid A 3-O-deacylase